MDYDAIDTEPLVSRPPPSYEYKRVYEELCRDETVYPADIQSQMKCFYWHGRDKNTFTAWAPLKTEMLYPEPLIVQFYDVITENESATLQKLATSRKRL